MVIAVRIDNKNKPHLAVIDKICRFRIRTVIIRQMIHKIQKNLRRDYLAGMYGGGVKNFRLIFVDFGIIGYLKQISGIQTNVYFDLSASCRIYYKTPFQDQFRWITEQIGPDHLLFGSDFPLSPKKSPHNPVYTQKLALEAVKNFGYPPKWIPKIIGENAANLLNIQ